MKLVTEATIDIDDKRKLWVIATAEGVDVDEVEEVVSSMAGALVEQVTSANNAVVKAKEAPKMPATFQEED